VEERSESSHMPITCKILSRKYNKDCNIKSNDNQHKTQVKRNFNSGNSADYRNQLHKMITQEWVFNISNMIKDLGSDINHLVDVFINLLHQCAECCKKQTTGLRIQQPKWFDTDCRTAKYKKIKSLRVFRRTRSDSNLQIYLSACNEFKTLCYLKQNKYRTKKLNELTDSSASPKSFWKFINSICGQRRTVNNSITLQEWQSYFEELFCSHTVPLDESAGMNHLQGIEIDELKNSIFNSEITEEEIYRAVKSLQVGKAGGEDPRIFYHWN
jgi:hypothetical protein